jgi:hypothetical protein
MKIVPCIGQFHKLLLIINLGAHLLIIVITLDFSCFKLGFNFRVWERPKKIEGCKFHFNARI